MISMERKSLYTFAPDYYYTEGHSEIQAFGDDVRPQIHEAFADELRTVQSVPQRMSIAPMEKGHSISAAGLYPTSKECGFYTHVDKYVALAAEKNRKEPACDLAPYTTSVSLLGLLHP